MVVESFDVESNKLTSIEIIDEIEKVKWKVNENVVKQIPQPPPPLSLRLKHKKEEESSRS